MYVCILIKHTRRRPRQDKRSREQGMDIVKESFIFQPLHKDGINKYFSRKILSITNNVKNCCFMSLRWIGIKIQLDVTLNYLF